MYPSYKNLDFERAKELFEKYSRLINVQVDENVAKEHIKYSYEYAEFVYTQFNANLLLETSSKAKIFH